MRGVFQACPLTLNVSFDLPDAFACCISALNAKIINGDWDRQFPVSGGESGTPGISCSYDTVDITYVGTAIRRSFTGPGCGGATLLDTPVIQFDVSVNLTHDAGGVLRVSSLQAFIPGALSPIRIFLYPGDGGLATDSPYALGDPVPNELVCGPSFLAMHVGYQGGTATVTQG